MKNNIVIGLSIAALVALLFTAFTFSPKHLTPMKFHCTDCSNQAKTEDSISDDYDELYLLEGQIITAVYVKAGQGCFIPDGNCYNIVDGGVGFNFVKVERLGDGPNCQGISHLEVCYGIEDLPTDTPTPTETDTPEPTFTFTPQPSETPTPENTFTSTPTSTNTLDPTSTPSTTPTPTDEPHPTFTPHSNGNKGKG